MPLNRLMAALAATWCLAAPAPSHALDFSTGVVRIVVPYLPGGSAEAQARFLAAELQKQWGKPVIIENKPGAGATIGAAFVATQKPDGHTLSTREELASFLRSEMQKYADVIKSAGIQPN